MITNLTLESIITCLHIYVFKTNSHEILYAQVVSEYLTKGMDFILQAINHPTYLEDLTGLTELMKSAGSYTLDWDNDSENDDNDDDCVEI